MDLVRQIRDHNKVRQHSLSLSLLAVPMTLHLRPAPHQELLQMRRFTRAITPDSAVKLPGAGCWDSNSCIVS
jgi:hypothetical protein